MDVGAIDLITDHGSVRAMDQAAAVRLTGLGLPVPTIGRSGVIGAGRIRERVGALSAGRRVGRPRSVSRVLNGISAAASVTFCMLVGDVTSPLPWMTGALALSTALGAEKVR